MLSLGASPKTFTERTVCASATKSNSKEVLSKQEDKHPTSPLQNSDLYKDKPKEVDHEPNTWLTIPMTFMGLSASSHDIDLSFATSPTSCGIFVVQNWAYILHLFGNHLRDHLDLSEKNPVVSLSKTFENPW